MTKILGVNVGTLVAKSGFAGVNDFNKDSNSRVIVRDYAGMTSSNVIGDQFSLGFMKSGSYIDPLSWLWFDAFGTSCTLNIGDATYASGLASAVAIASAGNAALWKGFTAAKMGMPLWQALGYSTDPKTTIELLGTIAGANVANTANLGWQLLGITR